MLGKPPSEAWAVPERGARQPGAPNSWLPPGLDAQAEALLLAAWQCRQNHHAPEICFARPNATTPVSLTGASCELGCDHCGGHYLAHMASLEGAMATADAMTAGTGGPRSFLVSGGCTASNGRVPFMDYLPALARLRERGRLNFHVGLVGEQEAKALAGLADTVSFDVVGDDDTIRDVLHLDRQVDDYRNSLMVLRRHVRVVPHILVGLHGGELRGERRAIEIAREAGCDALVFIVFIPTRGTPFAGCRPPDPIAVARLIADARLAMPDAVLGLGCMRPPGSYRRVLDPMAVVAGCQTIVMPAPEARAAAAEMGLRAIEVMECCVL